MRFWYAVLKQDPGAPTILAGFGNVHYNFDTTACPKRNKYRARIGMPQIEKQATYISATFYLLKWQFTVELTFSASRLGT
jgi:hypothetical protein